jgi:hypothetical protein
MQEQVSKAWQMGKRNGSSKARPSMRMQDKAAASAVEAAWRRHRFQADTVKVRAARTNAQSVADMQ